MAAAKKSVYLADSTLAVVGDDDSLSRRINTIVQRYGEIVADAMPTLTLSEWCLVADALGEALAAVEGTYPVRHLWSEIIEADRRRGLGEKWNTNAGALAERIRDMSTAERAAILEVVSRVQICDEGNPAEMLIAAGARISE